MNADQYSAGLSFIVKMAAEDQPQTGKAPPGLTKERAIAFATRDFPLTVIPMAVGLTAGEGLVRALNKSINSGGHPLSNSVRYGVPLGAATLSMLGMLAGHAHSKLLADRAAEVKSGQ